MVRKLRRNSDTIKLLFDAIESDTEDVQHDPSNESKDLRPFLSEY